MNVTLGVQLTAVVEPALVIANVADPVEPSWFASPANVALAVAVPALRLLL